MAKPPSTRLLKFLRACIIERPSLPNTCQHSARRRVPAEFRTLSTVAPSDNERVPKSLRKQLKEEAKASKREESLSRQHTSTIPPDLLAQYELTVGLEIHAELATNRKLFSQAATSLNATPNGHVSGFDAAIPGTQPNFQLATLLPAIRAALALACEIKHTSGWDRKHYFWWDQPQGYQITQYYDPFAVNGSITLSPSDFVLGEECTEPVKIGIKQIQMEQDTAKTLLQPPLTHLIDFNRVSHPLIEIITLPHIHDPQTAAAFVRKIQKILKAVGACDTGMEMGGLRVDVNVSVKKVLNKSPEDGERSQSTYAGVSGLGQRTEIKNLSTLAGIATAIALERDRQIAVLSSGGVIKGETRGWTIGATETHRLRGKEGEVDYRYMPDPDLSPLIIGRDLVDMLQRTLPDTPEETIATLVKEWGVSAKDASTMVDLDDGERCDYFFDVARRVAQDKLLEKLEIGRSVSNWIVHEIGALLSSLSLPFSPDIIPEQHLSDILGLLLRGQITYPTAKDLLNRTVIGDMVDAHGNGTDILTHVEDHRLRLDELSQQEYQEVVQRVIAQNKRLKEDILKAMHLLSMAAEQPKDARKRHAQQLENKIGWAVGQIVREHKKRVQPHRVKSLLLAEFEKELKMQSGDHAFLKDD